MQDEHISRTVYTHIYIESCTTFDGTAHHNDFYDNDDTAAQEGFVLHKIATRTTTTTTEATKTKSVPHTIELVILTAATSNITKTTEAITSTTGW